MAVETARKLGKYTLDRELGRGSTGIIYLGHDPYAQRKVAIKIYFPETAVNASQARLTGLSVALLPQVCRSARWAAGPH